MDMSGELVRSKAKVRIKRENTLMISLKFRDDKEADFLQEGKRAE